MSAVSSGSSSGWSLCSQPNSGSSLARRLTPQDLADGIRILILGMSWYSLGLRLEEASPGPVRVPEARLPVPGQVGVYQVMAFVWANHGFGGTGPVTLEMLGEM